MINTYVCALDVYICISLEQTLAYGAWYGLWLYFGILQNL